MLEAVLLAQDEVLARQLRLALQSMAVRLEHYALLSNDLAQWPSRKFDLMFLHPTPSVVDQLSAWVRTNRWPQSAATIALIPEDHMAFASALLDAGFDRCLPVSLDHATLCAVVRAVTRRKQGMMASVSHYGALSFNHMTQQAHLMGVALELTFRETQVLEILLKRVGQIIPKERFIQDMASKNMALNTTAAEVYIHRLRKKISHDILPVRNIKRCGYMLPRYVDFGEGNEGKAIFCKSSEDSIRPRYALVGNHLAV